MDKVEVKEISLSYNHVNVVNRVSFSLKPGEMVGLIGPNGCGKTSIIKALSRVLTVLSGEIRVDERALKSIPHNELAKILGVVPQNPNLPETFTVTEVVMLGRNPHLGWLRSESARDLEIVWQAMLKTGVAELAERKIGELSGGEKQRVTIARVLAQQPQAILLDEPTANLDIAHQIEALNLMRNLCREQHMMVLIALHDLNMASQFCDRLLLMKKGCLFAQGPAPQVITSANIKEVYGAGSLVYPHPENQLPVVLLTGASDKIKIHNN
ncbi:MAG TPA: heme ABC transporter ATP-binding protein [Dehalococcoidales bacterium]|nr:heme ABC transporter ATP-binding protein [Dehalococcoidales bacterium]